MGKLLQPGQDIKYYGAAVECGTLGVFLKALRCDATVLLTPIERKVPTGTGALITQLAVHVTARGLEYDHPVYYCTFWAAQFSHVGGRGRLIFPCKDEADDPQIAQRAYQLVIELERHIFAFLKADARVSALRAPARYRLPDAWVWGVSSSLNGTDIVFQNGCWARHMQSEDGVQQL